ncbi:MAG: aminoglycoside phosphotransferase family protein [Phycisphaerae bacterium]|nr:aminoglycoside phosphotransferase family protein [Phycisphaerae bacterium]
MKHDLADVVANFQIDGTLIEAMPYGSGHINDTYASRIQTSDGPVRFIHQRINHLIFTEPEKLMENIQRVTVHLGKKITEAGGNPDRETLTLIDAVDGNCFYRDSEGNYWRTYKFIEGAKTYDVVEKEEHVYNAAFAFGEFQKMLSDLPAPRLHETIPQFGDSPWRLRQFQDALAKDVANRAAGCKAEIDFVLARQDIVPVLMDLLEQKKVPERITHYDTKFNNVMIDDETGKGICVIDLDTVMPGIVNYDFGDSCRFGIATATEDETDLSKVGVNLDRFDRLSGGYLASAREFLTDTEIDHLAFSAKLITFTIGLRFITDHLAGDVYFKTHRENHNLDRCRTQFKMVSEMEKMAEQMDAIIAKYR